MKKISICVILVFSACCAPQQAYTDRVNHGIASVGSSVVRYGASALATGNFNAEQLSHEIIYTGGSEMQSQIYDDYYEKLRQQEEQKAWEQYYRTRYPSQVR